MCSQMLDGLFGWTKNFRQLSGGTAEKLWVIQRDDAHQYCSISSSFIWLTDPPQIIFNMNKSVLINNNYTISYETQICHFNHKIRRNNKRLWEPFTFLHKSQQETTVFLLCVIPDGENIKQCSVSNIMAVTHFEIHKKQQPLKQRGAIFYCARWQVYNFLITWQTSGFTAGWSSKQKVLCLCKTIAQNYVIHL